MYFVIGCCVLEEGCMDPPRTSISCDFAEDKFEIYAGCNRQDQSAINIIVNKLNNFSESRYWRNNRRCGGRFTRF